MAKNHTFVDQLIAIFIKRDVFTEAEGRIYREQFEESDHDSFEDFLMTEGLVSKEDLLDALSVFYKVPAVDVRGYYVDTELIRNFPKDFLLRNEILPLVMEEDFLVVAASTPNNSDLLPQLGNFTSEDIQFYVGLGVDIIDTVEEYYDKSVTEVPDDIDLHQEREEQDEFERDGQLEEED